MKKLLCITEYKQKVSEVSLPYEGSAQRVVEAGQRAVQVA